MILYGCVFTLIEVPVTFRSKVPVGCLTRFPVSALLPQQIGDIGVTCNEKIDGEELDRTIRIHLLTLRQLAT